jgi:cation diffusion facilitator CzcD-associated flavoprotein CzcO
MAREEVVVVGAGPAGLSAAAMIEAKGTPALVVERGESVAMSWRSRYDRLRLNTLRWMSTPPGYRIPRRYGRYPSRSDFVDYLEEYARRHKLRIEFGVEVQRIDPRWRLTTNDGDIEARNVVVATGYDRIPRIPDWPGKERFTGELIHAAAYRNPKPYEGKDVLVVACGNTGTEIAQDLAEGGAGRVWTSMRTPPNVVARELLGFPVNITAPLLDALPTPVFDTVGRLMQWTLFGNLEKHGIPPAPQGMQTTLLERGVAPVVDAGFVDLLKGGRIELVKAVEAFDGADVILTGGDRLQPDAVIAATGYERGLEPLVGHLGLIGERGKPVVHAAQTHPEYPGLYFTGYVNPLSGQLRPMRHHARQIAKAIAQRA